MAKRDYYEVLGVSKSADEKQIKSLKLEMRAIDDPVKKSSIQEKIIAYEKEISETKMLIPQTWKKTNKDFQLITKRLNRARMQFRRTSDQAYSEVRTIIKTVDATLALTKISDDIMAIRGKVEDGLMDLALLEVKAVYSELSKVPGANKAAKLLSKARRSIDVKNRNPKKALSFIDDVLDALRKEVQWRKKVFSGPYKKLVAFEGYTKNNLGLREQERLTEEQVDKIVPCLARHRNIALHF